MRAIKALLFVVLLLMAKNAAAAPFDNTVSTNFFVPNLVNLALTNSTMDTSYFTNQPGGCTGYSYDVVVDTLFQPPGNISAHATWVIRFTPSTRTVNLNAGKTHITNWFGSQRCNIYENNNCDCGGNRNWNICTNPAMAAYVSSLVVSARIASINARIALQAAGYNVTRN